MLLFEEGLEEGEATEDKRGEERTTLRLVLVRGGKFVGLYASYVSPICVTSLAFTIPGPIKRGRNKMRHPSKILDNGHNTSCHST